MYYIYIVECCDSSLYVGSTNNVEKRIEAHNHSKQGARYTKGRRPVTLRYVESHPTLGQALRREAEIKRWPRKKKLQLIVCSSIIL